MKKVYEQVFGQNAIAWNFTAETQRAQRYAEIYVNVMN